MWLWSGSAAEEGMWRERERDREDEWKGKFVCVTGASDYIASWLVKLLLKHGHTVKATVCDPSDPKKTEHLRALDGASERLLLLKANLLEKESFDAVVNGCEWAELIKPAIEGTLNVLKSCAKVTSIKRVILMLSMVAIAFKGTPLTPDVVVDETWYSDPSYCESKKLWYFLSKTLAEEAAWKFSEENRIDMVTINPGLVTGPLLQPTFNVSVEEIAEYFNNGILFNKLCVV